MRPEGRSGTHSRRRSVESQATRVKRLLWLINARPILVCERPQHPSTILLAGRLALPRYRCGHAPVREYCVPPVHSRVFVYSCLALLIGATTLDAQPAAVDMTAAIAAAVAKMPEASRRAYAVRAVAGCYPAAAENRPGLFLCLVEATERGGSPRIQPVPLAKDGAKWSVVMSDALISPACPTPAEAEPLFQRALRRDARVGGKPDSGTFTDERGKFRETHGPASGGERTDGAAI